MMQINHAAGDSEVLPTPPLNDVHLDPGAQCRPLDHADRDAAP